MRRFNTAVLKYLLFAKVRNAKGTLGTMKRYAFQRRYPAGNVEMWEIDTKTFEFSKRVSYQNVEDCPVLDLLG